MSRIPILWYKDNLWYGFEREVHSSLARKVAEQTGNSFGDVISYSWPGVVDPETEELVLDKDLLGKSPPRRDILHALSSVLDIKLSKEFNPEIVTFKYDPDIDVKRDYKDNTHDCWIYEKATNTLYYMFYGHHEDIFGRIMADRYGPDWSDNPDVWMQWMGFEDSPKFLAGDVKHGTPRDFHENPAPEKTQHLLKSLYEEERGISNEEEDEDEEEPEWNPFEAHQGASTELKIEQIPTGQKPGGFISRRPLLYAPSSNTVYFGDYGGIHDDLFNKLGVNATTALDLTYNEEWIPGYFVNGKSNFLYDNPNITSGTKWLDRDKVDQLESYLNGGSWLRESATKILYEQAEGFGRESGIPFLWLGPGEIYYGKMGSGHSRLWDAVYDSGKSWMELQDAMAGVLYENESVFIYGGADMPKNIEDKILEDVDNSLGIAPGNVGQPSI